MIPAVAVLPEGTRIIGHCVSKVDRRRRPWVLLIVECGDRAKAVYATYPRAAWKGFEHGEA